MITMIMNGFVKTGTSFERQSTVFLKGFSFLVLGYNYLLLLIILLFNYNYFILFIIIN